MAKYMTNISISMPDDLLAYLDQKVDNRSASISSLLQQWRQQQEDKALAEACRLVDELDLGWDEEWQNRAIMDSFPRAPTLSFASRQRHGWVSLETIGKHLDSQV